MSSSTDAPATLTIRVSKDLCCGAQLCVGIAPMVYRLDPQGYNASDGDRVPAGQEALAERGMRACPEQAIRLLNESSR
jgi:ferredoxin